MIESSPSPNRVEKVEKKMDKFIIRQKAEKGKNDGETKEFVAQVNPQKFSVKHVITYQHSKPAGTPETKAKPAAVEPQTIDFEFLFDDTGALGNKPDLENGVAKMVKHLEDVTIRYNGKEHRPRPITVTWGKLHFEGIVTALDISYELFDRQGIPLRAKAQISFQTSAPIEITLAKAANSSPDLTHYIFVKQGDTLPLLCNQIYKSPSWYKKVAEYNQLSNFRNLELGKRLAFPPLEVFK